MSFEVPSRSTGGPNMTPVFSSNSYVRLSSDTVGGPVAISGTGVSPPASAPRCVYVISPRISIWSYSAHAVPRYSPVGSNPLVHPTSCSSSRIVPPFVTVPLAPLGAELVLPPQAAATSARTTRLESATIVRRFTDFTPFSELFLLLPYLHTEAACCAVSSPDSSLPGHRCDLGSSASRNPSPRRVKASVVITRKPAGKISIHHATKYREPSVASLIMPPHEGVSGGMPTDR